MPTLPTEFWTLLAVVAVVSGHVAVETIRALAVIIRDLITRHQRQQD
jgi:hypothetical protein